jgi:hypothetical protein
MVYQLKSSNMVAHIPLRHLEKVIIKFWNEEIVPQELRDADIVTIFKRKPLIQ